MMNSNEWHSVTAIKLGQLIESGFFDWKRDIFDWHEFAYNEEQYERVCGMFIERFYWREIGIVPPGEWAQQLMYAIKYKLMPKYKYLYQTAEENGIDVLAAGSEYKKQRDVSSSFPETLLGGDNGNEVYASAGTDMEYEIVKTDPIVKAMARFRDEFETIDMMLLDELEHYFSGLWASHINSF